MNGNAMPLLKNKHSSIEAFFVCYAFTNQNQHIQAQASMMPICPRIKINQLIIAQIFATIIIIKWQLKVKFIFKFFFASLVLEFSNGLLCMFNYSLISLTSYLFVPVRCHSKFIKLYSAFFFRIQKKRFLFLNIK